MSGTDTVRVIRGSLDPHETAALMAVLATVATLATMLDGVPDGPHDARPRSADRPAWRPAAAQWDGEWSPVGGA